jgi:hypothetical protein
MDAYEAKYKDSPEYRAPKPIKGGCKLKFSDRTEAATFLAEMASNKHFIATNAKNQVVAFTIKGVLYNPKTGAPYVKGEALIKPGVRMKDFIGTNVHKAFMEEKINRAADAAPATAPATATATRTEGVVVNGTYQQAKGPSYDNADSGPIYKTPSDDETPSNNETPRPVFPT